MNWWQRIFGIRSAPAQPSARQQREELEEQIRIKRLTRASKLLEAYANQDYWLGSYSDILARYRDGGVLSYPISQPTDRRYGGNFPFWFSEQQLSLVRAQARMVTTMNPNAQGLLNGLTSYVIGTGYSYKAAAKPTAELSDELLDKVQKVIDDFADDNSWPEMEQELFYRSREDGEAFLRLFPQSSGRLQVRTVEPEQIFQPPGSDLAHYSYGIETDPDDVFDIKGYWVSYMAPGGKDGTETGNLGEKVDADEMVHIKCNVKRAIKRGLSDFSYETLDTFLIAGKLRANMGEGAAVQAAIAGIRQHDASNLGQVESFVTGQVDYSTYSPVTQKETDYQTLQSGSFLDIPRGMNYVPPPGASNATAHLEIFQALLRSAGNRHNAPEWLVSSNASNNNYASSLTAESPFLRSCVRLQKFYERPFRRVILAAITTAAKAGRLPSNILDLIDLQVTAPSVETRDKAQEAQANQVYSTLGVKSPQTIAHEIGLDWDEELANQQEARQELGAASPLPTDPSQLPPEQDETFQTDEGYAETIEANEKPGLWANIRAKRERGERRARKGSADYPDKDAFQNAQEAEGGKYAHIDFTPPQGARAAAKRALEVRAEKPESQRGMTPVGIARARDLSRGAKLSPETVRRMKAFFDRHAKDKQGSTWDDQGKGWQAWQGWGGDPGYAWARKVVRQMDAADKDVAEWRLTEGQWVTMGAQSKAPHNRGEGEGDAKRGGVPVYIDDDGTIAKGPAHMTGKKPSEIKKQQADAEPAPGQGGAEVKPEPTTEPKPEPQANEKPAEKPAEKLAAGRTKDSKPITFDQPIVGPSGAKLTSYEWQWTMGQKYSAREDGMVDTKISDWEKSEASSETGKQVVHQFRVTDKDGNDHLVSLEGAARMLGFSPDKTKKVKNVASAVKTLAKNEMMLAAIKQRQAYLTQMRKEAGDQISGESVPEPIVVPDLARGENRYLVRIGDYEQPIYRSGKPSADDLDQMKKTYRERRITDIIKQKIPQDIDQADVTSNKIDSLGFQIRELEAKIKTQKKRVQDLSKAVDS